MRTRNEITRGLRRIIFDGTLKNDDYDLLYDAIDIINAHKDDIQTGETYVCLEDIQKFPIRKNHYDTKNGNIHFINGIETVMEFIELLPRYKSETENENESSDLS